MFTNFGHFILIFHITVTLLPVMSGPNSPVLSPLGNAGVLSQAATKANALQSICFALPEKSIDSTVKDYRKHVSANSGHFEHIMR